ncbi:hypothetical protein KVT40_001081 [Elsinoe batatas]|uniref:Fe2OG dioxygenase domain-containing protein n=1 Tax=Elsinoe batatas TaxID=2601811 RepID=A0A8K0LCF9_9PEZI|nr:hypothetical protein KVT40_001081 [Elsinoe batatas]
MTPELDCNDLAPTPFPADVPSIVLPSVSLAKLLSRDKDEAFKVTEVMGSTCIQLYKDILAVARFAGQTFKKVPVPEKQAYKRRDGSAVLDKGYTTALGTFEDDGTPVAHETLNIPAFELFDDSAAATLPSWLVEQQALFKRIFERAFEITHLILEAFQTALQVSGRDMLDSHNLTASSGHTIRLLHYTANTYGKVKGLPTLSAHRDWTSLTLVFNWLGGLQIPKDNARWLSPDTIHDEDWDWVRPVHGTAIVNAGEALQYLTGGKIKSGLHRVVPPPAPQDQVDRYAVFVGLRPRNDWPMLPYKSDLIEPSTEHIEFSGMTCEEWGAFRIGKWLEAAQARARKDLMAAGGAVPAKV